MKDDIPKKKMPFFCIFKSLSNKQQLLFYFMGALKLIFGDNSNSESYFQSF